jgi:hypothetical protein
MVPEWESTKLSMDDHPKKGDNHGENHWGKWKKSMEITGKSLGKPVVRGGAPAIHR